MINGSSEIKNWMLATHRIQVPDDWLEACIEWIKEEQQETNTVSTIENVRNLVFEQWLMSDLRELNSQCLPEGLSSQIKIELNGNFPLQIESIVDVGTSCYSQLQKIQGTENANVGVSADTTLQPAWEPKPSKMLYFKLTDGTNDIQAMEYKPLSCLDTQTILGTKILVYGSVICRRGVLLLKEENIHVYGGEVDSLIENNPPEKILQKALEENIRNAGKSEKKEFSGEFIERGNNSFKKQSFSSNTCIKTETKPKIKTEVLSQPFKQNVKEEVKVENQTYTNPSNVQNRHIKQEPAKVETVDAAWDDDFDDEMFMDDMDDDLLLSMETDNKQTVTSNTTQSSNNQNITSATFQEPKNSNSDQNTRVQGSKSSRISSNTPLPQTKKPKLEQQKIENMFSSHKKEKAPTFKSLHFGESTRLNTSSKTSEDQGGELSGFDDELAAMVVDDDDDDFKLPDDKNSSFRSNLPKAVIHPFNTTVNNEATTSISNERNSTRFEQVDENEPFTYLSILSDSMPYDSEHTVKVKAYISTLTSKLTSGQGESWTLACKINDGTYAIDVDLSNAVLSDLIGFSAEDSIAMRKQARSNPSVKEVLLNGIQQCQQKLVDLSCILELKVKPYSIRPIITKIITIEKHHTELLLKRVLAKLNS